MRDIFKYGLLAVGGYFLYKQFQPQLASLLPSPGGGIQPVVPSKPEVKTEAEAPKLNTKNLVLKAAAGQLADDQLLSGDQWNYFYEKVRGTSGPDPTELWPDRDRAFRMSVDEWWSSVSAKGFTGLGCPGGLCGGYVLR